MISTGASNNHVSAQAAAEAADKAAKGLNGNRPGFAIAFCSNKHNEGDVITALRKELGDIPIVGGAAIGVADNGLIGYSGYECAVALFDAALGETKVFSVDGIDKSETDAGEELGKQMAPHLKGGESVLLFWDSIKSPPPPAPVLNSGGPLLEGMYKGMGRKDVTLTGGGTVLDFNLTRNFVFDGARAATQKAVAVILPPRLKVETKIMHGCAPISADMEVTKAQGNLLLELDGRPALDVILETLQLEKNEENIKSLTMVVTLGKRIADDGTAFDESDYVNRLILAGIPENGGVALFDEDFRAGDSLQLMSRDNDMMIESTEKAAQEITDGALNGTAFALYINCAGRSGAFCGAEREDMELLQTAIGDRFPFLGFYSGVEVAPFHGTSRPLDWTGVLATFHTDANA